MKLKQIFSPLSNLKTFLQNKWFLLTIILISASLWRLTNLNLVEFKGDEGLNLFLATRPLFGHPMPPASLASSVGILNFPLLNYLLFPIVLISYYPPFVSGSIAFLNVLAIGAFFLLVTKYFNKSTAFISTLLFSLAPWAIIYSRKIWAQDFLMPLVIALLFCFFKLYKEKKQIYWIFYAIIALFLIQIHQTAGILPVLLIIPLFQKTRPNFLFIFIGIIIGLIPTIPYIAYEFSNSCPDCQAIFLLHSKLESLHPDIIIRIFQITTPGYFHTLMGDTDNLTFTNLFPLTTKLIKLSYLVYILLPFSLFVFWKKYKEYRSFILITISILFIFFLLKIQPEMHYVIILIPFLFLFLGALLSQPISQRNMLIKILGLSLVSLFVFIYLFFDFSFFKLLSIKKGFGGDYGNTYYSASQTATQTLKKYKNSLSYNEMILAFYVPVAYIQGDTPVGKLLYPLSYLNKNISTIDDQIKSTPTNPIFFNQAVAFYTYPQNETTKNIFFLKSQSQYYPSFSELYTIALGNYLSKNHKHYFEDSNMWFEYPEHWNKIEDTSIVEVSDENILLIFSKSPSLLQYQSWDSSLKIIDNQPLKMYRCEKNGIWCGSIIPNLQLNGSGYTINLLPKDDKIPKQTLITEEKNLNDVLNSLTQPVY